MPLQSRIFSTRRFDRDGCHWSRPPRWPPLNTFTLCSATYAHCDRNGSSQAQIGPQALAAGLALSFVVVGIFVATAGFALGLDAGVVRSAGAVGLVLIGGVLLPPQLQARFALAAGPLSKWTEGGSVGFRQMDSEVSSHSGFSWAPSGFLAWVRPSAPLHCLPRKATAWGRCRSRWSFSPSAPCSHSCSWDWYRERLSCAGVTGSCQLADTGKIVMGSTLIIMGLMIITGYDKTIEAVLVDASPEWLTRLTTRF